MLNENLLAPDQRTDKWYQDRSGKFTASRFVDLLSKPNKAYSNLIMQVVGERLTGQYQESGMDSYALKHGREVEPYARERYELETGLLVTQTGFIQCKAIPFAGASPDGLVGDDGGLEIKCPKDWNVHLERFENGIGKEFMPQVQGCMLVTGRKWWDWVSYDPRVSEHLMFYRQRIWRDENYIEKLRRIILLAESEVRTSLKFFEKENIELILNERVKEKK